MTGHEVWELWKENPKRKFIGTWISNIMILNELNTPGREDTGAMILGELNTPRWEDTGEMVSIISFMETDWQPVETDWRSVEKWKEVTFLEAIEAWVNELQIKSVKYGVEYIYQSELLKTKGSEEILNLTEARAHKWYIKEE